MTQTVDADQIFVAFAPSGQRGFVAPGTTVLAAARQLGVDLDSVCGGRGICGRCQIVLSEGHHARLGITVEADSLSAQNSVEVRYIEKRGTLSGNRRLGCQCEIRAHTVIDVPEDSQLHRQIVRKDADDRVLSVDPLVHLHFVRVTEPDMHAPSGDAERLIAALRETFGLGPLEIPLPVLETLQKTLRAGGFEVTAAVHSGERIVALYPGLVTASYGVAVDIGSTTIAAHLTDLATGAVVGSAGIMNPQIRFGEDLMSRVSFSMMNPGGAADMTAAVRHSLNDLIGALAASAGIAREAITDISLVGNPIMHHLFLGLDPVELGGAPFALTVDKALTLPARELGLNIAPGALAYLLPLIAGHVGADTAGVVLAEAPDAANEITLLVDIGTNAEIVLGNRNRLIACSSPTGPAFEGAQISSGQRAAPGAIERIRIDRATLEPRFKVIGSDLWSDDPAFDAGVTGICGSGIIEAVAELYLSGVIAKDGRFDGQMATVSPRVEVDGRSFRYVIREGSPRITITQSDIRAIQLAKSALAAGTRLLMQRFGTDKVDRIRLAGAFGSHIDVTYAMAIGLIPDCAPAAIGSAGNAAGTGARIALVSRAARRHIEATVQKIEKIETALEPGFQDAFVAAMAFPHASEPYPQLWQVFDPPTEKAPSDDGRPRRSRRRE